MSRRLDRIRQDRRRLQDPYAHIDDLVAHDDTTHSTPRDTHDARRLLENPYAYANGNGYCEAQAAAESRNTTDTTCSSPPASPTNRRSHPTSKNEIEAVARGLQKELWDHRRGSMPNEELSPLLILDPTRALENLGFSVHLVESLGQATDTFGTYEVAGLFDGDSSEVYVSRQFPPDVRRFTLAHELGHALLHGQSGLHRDRPTNPTSRSRPRVRTEIEADLFASYFLLPRTLVTSAFRKKFLTERFVLNEETAFAIGATNAEALRKKLATRRELSRLLAATQFYNGCHGPSVASQFGVSTEAMAIRLEDLQLIRPINQAQSQITPR